MLVHLRFNVDAVKTEIATLCWASLIRSEYLYSCSDHLMVYWRYVFYI